MEKKLEEIVSETYREKFFVLSEVKPTYTNKTPHVVGILLICTYFIWMMVL